MKDVAIVGAGAAGCFCAVEIKRRLPDARVTVYEAGPRPMAKLSITGGGRCNFTNSFASVNRLEDVYPRGAQLMKRALRTFGPEDTRTWFAREGVPSVVQDDDCVFPRSQDAMQVVGTLDRLMRETGVLVKCGCRVGSISDINADAVVVATGGTSSDVLRQMLPDDIEVVRTVPSLFTFKIPDNDLKSLMGTVVQGAVTGIAGTGFRTSGPLLVTDWGVSGPAILRLSSHAARWLCDNAYRGNLIVNWLGLQDREVSGMLSGMVSANPRRQLAAVHPEELTGRLWKHLLRKSGLKEDMRWGELGAKGIRRLADTLTAGTYPIEGRAKFKEEFVTCGGVALSEINLSTMESRKHPGLYFIGEVLDMDAVTGGFNLQGAWSTGYAAAAAISGKMKI